MEPSKFKVGDRVYYDDDPGKVLDVRETRRPYSRNYAWDVEVEWAPGTVHWVWESDLLTEAEYHAHCEPWD